MPPPSEYSILLVSHLAQAPASPSKTLVVNGLVVQELWSDIRDPVSGPISSAMRLPGFGAGPRGVNDWINRRNDAALTLAPFSRLRDDSNETHDDASHGSHNRRRGPGY